MVRDVEVRSRPVEYSAVVETLFACTVPGAMSMVGDSNGGGGQSNMSQGSSSRKGGNNKLGSTGGLGMAEAAAYVCAGGILPPGGILAAASNIISNASSNSTGSSGSGRRPPLDGSSGSASGRNFSPCPTVNPEQLLSECWNPLCSLALSMAYAASGCCETAYVQNGGPFEQLNATGEDGHGGEGEAPFTPMECMDMIEGVANTNNIATNVEKNDDRIETVGAEEVFDAHLLQLLGVAISPSMGKVAEGGRRLSEMLMDIVINVVCSEQMNSSFRRMMFFTNTNFIYLPHSHSSMFNVKALNDINLCQRLFFLLRSFTSSLEELKLPHGYTSESSALAMRLCRYAQRRLSGRMFDHEVYPINRESTSNILAINVSDSGESPSQEPNIPRQSSLDNNAGGQHEQSIPIAESSSGDMLASFGESPTLEQPNDQHLMDKKKSKGKKILRMLKGGKSAKKPSSEYHDGDSTPSGHLNGGGSSTVGNVRKSPKGSSKSFPFPFHKKNHSAPMLQALDVVPPSPTVNGSTIYNHQPAIFSANSSTSLSRQFENMGWILRQLDNCTSAIEKNLMKTFSQKITDWALYPWSASKESALASVTASFRSELRLMNPSTASAEDVETRFPILNPVNPTELLTSVDADECFILPSAHFPLLLCFNSEYQMGSSLQKGSGDTRYRTKVEILGLNSTSPQNAKGGFLIQGAVAGVIQESGVSDISRRSNDSAMYRWTSNSTLVFETGSNWGYPKALSLKVSSSSKSNDKVDEMESSRNDQTDVGCGFVGLCPVWKMVGEESNGSFSIESKTNIYLFDSAGEFDQHGEAVESSSSRQEVRFLMIY